MRKIKKIIIDIPTTILIIISLSILFFLIYNDIYYLKVIEKGTNNTIVGNYNYASAITISRSSKEQMLLKTFNSSLSEDRNYILGLLQNIPCNSYAKFSYNIDQSPVAHTGYICMAYGEPFKRKLKIGKYPNPDETKNEKTAIVGTSIYETSYTKNDDYYTLINGIEYKIRGVFENYSISGDDYSFVIFYDEHSQSEKEMLDKCALSVFGDFIFASDKLDEVTYNKIINDIKLNLESNVYNYNFNYTNIKVDYGNNEIVSEIEIVVTKLLIVFASFNVIISFNLWIKRRKKELSIRIVYGFNIFQLYIIIYKQLIISFAITLILSSIFNNIYSILLGRIIEIQIYISYFLYIVAFLFLLIILISIFNLSKIRVMKPTDAISGGIYEY